MISWDIIFWTDENAVDYMPSHWSNETNTAYKYPVGPRMTDQKKRLLINSCANLEEGQYMWHNAICKRTNVMALEKAKALCKKGEYTSCLDSEEDVEASEDDEDEEIEKIKQMEKRKLEKCSDKNFSSYKRPRIRTVTHSPLIHTVRENGSPFPTATVSEVDSPSTPTSNFRNIFPTVIASSSSNNCSQSASQYERLTFEIHSLKEEMNKKFERMERLLLSMAQNNSPLENVQNYNIEEILPLRSTEDVEKLETELLDQNFKKELQKILILTGGADIHKNVYNILKKLFLPELTLSYSATGKRGKLSFVSLKLYSVVKDVLRKRFEQATDQEILKSVIRFFTSAKDRIKK